MTTDTPPSAATSCRLPAMSRRPSATAPPRPWVFALAVAWASGLPSSRVTPITRTTETRNVPASTTRTGQAAPAVAAMTPVIPAPMTPATMRVACPRELAASRASAGTTRGIIAIRAGEKKVPMTACRQARANRSGRASFVAARTMPSTTTARRLSDAIMIRRRSWRSAQAPANRPTVTGGSATRIDISAIAAVEPVRCRTSRNRAR